MTSDVSTLQTYAPRFKWELKTGELNVQQRRQARAMLFGQFGQKKCFFTGRPIVPQLLHDAYDLHHLVKRGSPVKVYLTVVSQFLLPLWGGAGELMATEPLVMAPPQA